MEHLVFAYGTLKEAKIRRELLNRDVAAIKDSLPGFTLENICIGGVLYPIAVRDPYDKKPIPGEVFQVTSREIRIIDEYESNAYKRIKVNLNSGRKAWLYIRP